MIHFIYLTAFAFFISVAFGAFHTGTTRDRLIYAAKSFGEFMVISFVLAWLLYFIPWGAN
jgi:hypothetical protein